MTGDESLGTSLATARGAQGFHLALATVLTVVGSACVVLGGLVAAVAEPLDLAHGTWLAAYLVLVGGVAQFAMGHARRWRPEVVQSHRWGWVQIGSWNVGNAMVIGATLAGEPFGVDLGSVLLFVALGIALHAARPVARPAVHQSVGRVPPLADFAYRTLLLVLVVSIPVGMVLSHLRQA